MLPQIALGHSQSSILNSAYFENKILNLNEIMIPPMQSSSVKMEDIKKDNLEQTKTQKTQQSVVGKTTSENEVGRPEKSDSEKSEKTIQNRESMS